MCGRYTLTRQDGIIEELEAQLAIETQPESVRAWWKPRFNIAPTQPAPVVHLDADHKRTLELMRWGLVPAWANRAFLPGEPRPPLMINARSESIEAKDVYREAFHHHRCLVPADGFFEWLGGNGKSKPDPLYFHPVPRRVIAFAGVWVQAGDLRSFAILTCKPNALVAPVHNRQPLVLAHGDYAAWLDPATDLDVARAMLHTPAMDDWRADPVSRHVNKALNDDPACIELAAPAQGSLF